MLFLFYLINCNVTKHLKKLWRQFLALINKIFIGHVKSIRKNLMPIISLLKYCFLL